MVRISRCMTDLPATAAFLVLLAFFSGVLAPRALFGQTATLTGSVVDSLSREPLVAANVAVTSDGVQTGVATDARGRFEVPRLPAGTYRVTVSFVGYEQQVLDQVALEAGQTWSRTFSLMPTDLELNPLTVTASLGAPQKLVEAPSAISVLDARELEARTVLTAADHLKTAPGVDLVATGIAQSRVVIRGFNDNLASSLLTLVDNRIAQVPSIRLTALQLIPIGSFDVDRIELVSGPASAVYGPNSANGVVHVITKSPFESQGTVAGVAVGQNDIRSASLSHTAVWGERIGYRISGQYVEGNDFEYHDPVELTAREEALQAGADPDTLRIGARDFGVRNLAVSGRIDYRFGSAGSLILNSGLTRGTDIELSPTGAVQVANARVGYVQARLFYHRLFAQTYWNALEAGDSFILRTGMPFKERSRQWVAQVQNSTAFGGWQTFSYGLDVFLTRPNSQGTVSRRFEGRDDINEFGAYVQSETELTSRLRLIAAGRLDRHNWIDGPTFSPRLAAVYRVSSSGAVRASFNRAYQTPGADKLFADVLGQRDVFQGYRLEPLLGFSPTTDLWAQGSADGGFHFSRTADGALRFQSPFASLDPRGLTPADPIAFNDPTFTNTMWEVARQASVYGLPQGLSDAGLIPAYQALPMTLALSAVLPQALEGVDQKLMRLDLETQAFDPIADADAFDALDITRYQTVELGYQGIVGRQLLLGVDLYHTRVANFIGPFQVVTPNVFLDPATLRAYLETQVTSALAKPRNAAARSVLNTLDQLPAIGNKNGTSADEISWLVGETVAAAIPFGTVSPDEAFETNAVILGRRNFGDISLSGIDTRFTLFVTRAWTLSGAYSYVSRNFFANVDGVDDIALNAPRHKFSGALRYNPSHGRFEGEVRLRRVGAFPVRSDVYVGRVDAFAVLDVSGSYAVPFSHGTRLAVTIQNVMDNQHREFVNTPEISRLAMLRVTHAF